MEFELNEILDTLEMMMRHAKDTSLFVHECLGTAYVALTSALEVVEGD